MWIQFAENLSENVQGLPKKFLLYHKKFCILLRILRRIIFIMTLSLVVKSYGRGGNSNSPRCLLSKEIEPVSRVSKVVGVFQEDLVKQRNRGQYIEVINVITL